MREQKSLKKSDKNFLSLEKASGFNLQESKSFQNQLSQGITHRESLPQGTGVKMHVNKYYHPT
jgi:hypothetical protein